MKPLLAFAYYRRNKALFAVLLTLTLLSTMLVAGTISAMDSTSRLIPDLSYLKHASALYSGLDEDRDRISSQDFVEAVFDVQISPFKQPAWPVPYNLSLIAIHSRDVDAIMDAYSVQLQAGRWWEPGERGILLSEEIALAYGLSIGEEISNDIAIGSFPEFSDTLKLVGILQNRNSGLQSSFHPRLAFVSLEFLASQPRAAEEFAAALLVVPTDGHLRQMNAWLGQEYAAGSSALATHSKLKELYLQDWAGLAAVFGFISVFIALATTWTVALINRVALTRRTKELATLGVLGHGKAAILSRFTREIASLAFAGWGVGLVSSLAILWLVDLRFFAPKGIAFLVLNPLLLPATAPIPFILILLGRWHIGRVLRAVDPVSLIETGEDQQRRPVSGISKQGAKLRTCSWSTFLARHPRLSTLFMGSVFMATALIMYPAFTALAFIDGVQPLHSTTCVMSTRYTPCVEPRSPPK